MSMFEGFKNMLGINQDPEDDEYLDGGEDEVFAGGNQGQTAPDAYAQTEETRQRNKVVNINATTQLQVVLVKPERFEDASAIADQLNAKRTVVLNLESTNKQVSRRLIDFLSGVAYATTALSQSHHALQCGYHGRPDRRAGEQWRLLLMPPSRRRGAFCPRRTTTSAA